MYPDNFKSASFKVFLIISISIIFFNLNFFPGNILSWDVFGYYMYLPMIFIYDNWGLQNLGIIDDILKTYNSSSSLYQAYETGTGSWLMRYSMGMSVFYFPFFIIGHILAVIMNFPTDGFSPPYQTAIFYGGVVYSLTGFYLLRKILLKYYSEFITALTLIAIYFGTNYFFHTGFHGQNAMSHNVLFTMYALIIWITIRWHETFQKSYLILIALSCGLTILARPSEIVCLFIPLLWGVQSINALKAKIHILFNDKFVFSLAVLVFVLIGMPQLIYWKIITGKFLFNSMYNPGEGFNFDYPYLIDVLFSFRKGWLVYTPIMLLAIIGIFIMFKQRNEHKFLLILFFTINLYIVSSWSCWWYAESYSSRALIQSYALLSLPVAAFINWVYASSKKISVPVTLLIIFLISLNLFQTWQFLNNIIHHSRMTKAAYFAVLGKTHIPADLDNLLLINRSKANTDSIENSKYKNTLEFSESFENMQGSSSSESSHGEKSWKIQPGKYSPLLKFQYKELSYKDHIKIEVSAMIKYSSISSKSEFIARIDHKGKEYGFKSIKASGSDVKTGEWQKISFVYLTPVIRVSYDNFKLYLQNTGDDVIYMDNLKIGVWEPVAD